MKLAATRALATIAKETVPVEVLVAYDLEKLEFGRDYIIPKPLDPRLISRVASAVARAAIETGVAKFRIDDWDAYMKSLDKRTSDHIKRIAQICCL